MSLKEVFASLEKPSSRISWQNDLVQDLIVDRFFNNVNPVFEATILTDGHDPSASTGGGSTPTNLWCRLRPHQTSDLMLQDPFTIKVGKVLRKVINQHPIGWLKKAQPTQKPVQGEVWQCRYTTRNKMGIELLKKVRGSKKEYVASEIDDGSPPAAVETTAAADTTVGEFNAEYAKNPAIGFVSPSLVVKGTEYGNRSFSPDEVKFRYYLGSNTLWHGKKVYNGNIPPELLTTTSYNVAQNWVGPKSITILTEAIPFWNSFSEAYVKEFGHQVPINSSYRSYAGQAHTRDKKKSQKKERQAAYPGRSNHGWGLALDIQPHMKNPYKSMPRDGRGKKNVEDQPWVVPPERTSGKYKYPQVAGKAGTKDWKWKYAGYYADFYIWAVVEGNGAAHRWMNPKGLRNAEGVEEHWHYDYSEINKIFSQSPPAEVPGED